MNISELKLNNLSKQIYEDNKLRGFDVSKDNIGQTLMLIVSELSEALEADRKGRYVEPRHIKTFESDHNEKWEREPHDAFSFETNIKDKFEDEIADAFIRLFDLCGGLGIDIEKHIELKLRYNATRGYKHGKRY